MTQTWTSGYVADVTYIEGFYVQQSPARMALAGLFGNVAVDLPEPEDAASYLELGCGCGIGALLTAASNPGWQVTAIDYNPAHIAIGTGIARAARLDNIRFLEADLNGAHLAGWPLALLHGIGTGSDTGAPWLWLVDGLCIAAVGGAVAWRFSVTPSPRSEHDAALPPPARRA